MKYKYKSGGTKCGETTNKIRVQLLGVISKDKDLGGKTVGHLINRLLSVAIAGKTSMEVWSESYFIL